jgi:hypothetical protein
MVVLGRARWLNWRTTVIGMLVLLLVVLPYYHCYRMLANTREPRQQTHPLSCSAGWHGNNAPCGTGGPPG